MKKFRNLMIAAFFFTALSATAQQDKKVVNDTTVITVGNKVITIISDSSDGGSKYLISKVIDAGDPHEKKERKKHQVELLSLDLGFNVWTYNDKLNLPPKFSDLDTRPLNSGHVGLHLLATRISLIQRKVNLLTAITFDWTQFAFQDNVSLVPDRDTLTIFQDSIKYQKSKLTATYLQVPLLLHFQTNPDNKKMNFRVSAGPYAGMLIGGKSKIKTADGDKVKIKDDFNMEKFRFGVTARIGYGGVDFYVNYNFKSLFREDQGPELVPISFGVNLIGPF